MCPSLQSSCMFSATLAFAILNLRLVWVSSFCKLILTPFSLSIQENTHTNKQTNGGHIVYHTCTPFCSHPLFFFVSAGIGTPAQACTGTHRWSVTQYLGLASCTGLHRNARRPGIKPDSSGLAPLVQMMHQREKLTLDHLNYTASKWTKPAHVNLLHKQ